MSLSHPPHSSVRIRLILRDVLWGCLYKPAVPPAAINHQIKRTVAGTAHGAQADGVVSVLCRGGDIE